jgi:hypothetical protein
MRTRSMLCSLFSMVSSMAAILKGLEYRDSGMRTRSIVSSLLAMVSSVAAILKTGISGPWHKD